MSGQKSKSRLSQLQSTAIPKNKLSNYQKKQLLKMLTDDGCHPDQLNKMSSRFKIADTNVIKGKLPKIYRKKKQSNLRNISHFIDFVNIQAESSQNRLEKIFRTKNQKHFMNLDECAKSIVENNQTASDNMLPVTLEAIANLEKHPPPGEVSGVDLKALYQMLANMSAGYPVKDLPEGPTKEFLKQCYTVSVQ